jgi:hypothetical protein
VERFLIFYRKYRYFSFGKPVYFDGYFGQFTGITGLPGTGIAIPNYECDYSVCKNKIIVESFFIRRIVFYSEISDKRKIK